MKKLLSLLIGVMLVCSFGVCGAEEPLQYINDPVNSIAFIPEYTKGAITLTEGWNLIAMPVLPTEPYTVETFIKDVETDPSSMVLDVYPPQPTPDVATDWKVPVVAVYKNGQFERYPKEGVSYNMVPGEAYFVYAKYNGPRAILDPKVNPDGTFEMPPDWHPKTRVTIIGRPLKNQITLNLNRGWNGDSVPKWPTPADGTKILKMTTMNQVSKELTAQGIKAVRLAFWLAANQEWEQWDLPRPVDNDNDPNTAVLDREIRADEGFFLLCEENGLYIPGLNTQTAPEPPVPPDPPEVERVSYTGRVAAVFYIPEDRPPYDYRIFPQDNSDSNFQIGLKGANEEIEKQLAEAAADSGNICHVEGVMQTVITKTMLSPYTHTWTFLMVDSVKVPDAEAVKKLHYKVAYFSGVAMSIYNEACSSSDPHVINRVINILASYSDVSINEIRAEVEEILIIRPDLATLIRPVFLALDELAAQIAVYIEHLKSLL